MPTFPFPPIFSGNLKGNEMNDEPTAVQINMFPTDAGLSLHVYSEYDAENRTCKEIAKFVVPWHEVGALSDRMERSEAAHIEVVSGKKPF